MVSSNLPPGHAFINETEDMFKRCIKVFNKYPRVWLMCAKFYLALEQFDKVKEVFSYYLKIHKYINKYLHK